MNLIRFAIERPVAVVAAVFMVVMFGLVALQTPTLGAAAAAAHEAADQPAILEAWRLQTEGVLTPPSPYG